MVRKLALVAGVGVVWLVTFVVMGGSAVPSIDFSASTPTNGAGAQAGPIENALPLSAAATGAPSDLPGSAASTVESLAGTVPLAGATLRPKPQPRRAAAVNLTFRLASFNVLGSSHTSGSQKRASGVSRMSAATRYVLNRDISIVGFQEMQGDQRARFLAETNGSWGLFPGGSRRSGDGDNSIGWNKNVWSLVKADTTPIPYFYGRDRNIPVLLLKNKQSGITIYMTNFHNPADVRGNQQRWRNVATQRQITLFRALSRSGLPILVTGDMNERTEWACQILPGADMRAAIGGHGRDGCSVVRNPFVDWIVGSYDLDFSNYVADNSLKSITDHPVIISDVTINSRDFPKSVS
ncbi:MAG: endonuclease/exonuclease/phosphatase family protein [Propionibacteriales bacterium]|nr:endonuclease/exonuclease/phosphatase family protein [Propionibacteriales bacterium]